MLDRTSISDSVLLLLALCVLDAISGCKREPVAREKSQTVPASAESPLDFRSLVYSASFAQRFRLPARGVEKLETGLQAVALRVSDSSERGPSCGLDLYLDESAYVAYPEGSEGRADDTRKMDRPGALGLFYQIVADDSTRESLFHRWAEPRGVFQARNSAGTLEEFQVFPPESFYRSIVEGLNVVSFEVICTVLRADSGSVEARLLRTGRSPEELKPTESNDAVTQRFIIPARLLKHAKRAIAKAADAQTDLTRIKSPRAIPEPAYSLPD
jgi:hypothetical protein